MPPDTLPRPDEGRQDADIPPPLAADQDRLTREQAEWASGREASGAKAPETLAARLLSFWLSGQHWRVEHQHRDGRVEGLEAYERLRARALGGSAEAERRLSGERRRQRRLELLTPHARGCACARWCADAWPTGTWCPELPHLSDASRRTALAQGRIGEWREQYAERLRESRYPRLADVASELAALKTAPWIEAYRRGLLEGEEGLRGIQAAARSRTREGMSALFALYGDLAWRHPQVRARVFELVELGLQRELAAVGVA